MRVFESMFAQSLVSGDTPRSDSDWCCTCERCHPHRELIQGFVQYLDDRLALPEARLREPTPFDGTTASPISMRTYVTRFTHNHGAFDATVIPVALVYLERTVDLPPPSASSTCSHPLTRYNVHRIVAIAFILAYKYLMEEQEVASSVAMAKISGFSTVSELYYLERYTLAHLNWHLFVSVEQFEAAKTRLLHAQEVLVLEK